MTDERLASAWKRAQAKGEASVTAETVRFVKRFKPTKDLHREDDVR